MQSIERTTPANPAMKLPAAPGPTGERRDCSIIDETGPGAPWRLLGVHAPTRRGTQACGSRRRLPIETTGSWEARGMELLDTHKGIGIEKRTGIVGRQKGHVLGRD